MRAAVFLLACAFLASATFAKTTPEKLGLAGYYYEQAEKMTLDLEQVPAEKRNAKDYEAIIQMYRRVYRTAPTSFRNPKAFMAIGDLYQAMAYDLKKPKYYNSAIEAYNFLMQEYPYTPMRRDALLKVAQIYQSDLREPEEARKRYQQILDKFPNSVQAEKARAGLAEIQADALGAKPPVALAAGAAAVKTPPLETVVATETSSNKTQGKATREEQERAESAPEETGGRVPITDIRAWVTAESTRIVVDLAGEVKYSFDKLSNPPRIYVDLHGTKLSRAIVKKAVATEGGLVKRVRVGLNQIDVTRVVVEVDESAEYSVFDLTNPYRLVIEVRQPQKKPSPAINLTQSKRPDAAPQTTPAAETKAVKEARSSAVPAAGIAERSPLSPGSSSPAPAALPAPAAQTAPVRPAIVDVAELLRSAKVTPPAPIRSKIAQKLPPAIFLQARVVPPPAEQKRSGTQMSQTPRRNGEPDRAAANRELDTASQTKAEPLAASLKRDATIPAVSAAPEASGTQDAIAKMDPPRAEIPARSSTGARGSPAPMTDIAHDAHLDSTESGSLHGTAEHVQEAAPNHNGTRSLTRALGLKIGRIILDPGHGGHDTGTVGPTGLEEKDLVLDVALRLGKLITDRLGSEVIYTRTDDTFIPLETRTAIANEKQADLFLSIHANSSPSPRAKGIEAYYLSFATDPEALEVAARENAGSQESIHDLQDVLKKIALQEKVDESREFAMDVLNSLHDRLNKDNRNRANRGVKKAPFIVLVGARMPSVLAEISFLSNPQEEKLLRTKAHRQKIAEALYAGVARYVDTLSGVKVATRTENIETASK